MVDTMNYLVNKKVSVLTNKTFARNDLDVITGVAQNATN